MLRTRTISPHEACLIAVSALDDMVTALVKTSFLKVSPAFLDWIVDEATLMVEQHVEDVFDNPVFAASLRQADHRVALTNWVRNWVCPAIVSRFSELAVYLPVYTAMEALTSAARTPGSTALPVPSVVPKPLRQRPRGGLGLAQAV
jgi:hypothetical protein